MFLETKTDEAITSLDRYIAKKRDSLKLQAEINSLHRALCAAENEQLAQVQRVDNLEAQVKSAQKKVFTGEVKPGEISALKITLEEARKRVELGAQPLSDQRESLCAGQDALSQINGEILELRKQLMESLPALFMKRFHEEDPRMGTRGQIAWVESDPNGEKEWRRQWKRRVFEFLFHYVVNNRNELRFLGALVAFFKREPFYVCVRAGFCIDRPGAERKLFDVVGDEVLVPTQIDFENAFEEIIRGRVEFVSE